jgi:hypothetical protein
MKEKQISSSLIAAGRNWTWKTEKETKQDRIIGSLSVP